MSEIPFDIIEEKLRRFEDECAHIVLNTDGVVMVWNTHATELFGWIADEAVGQPLADLVIPETLRASHRAGLQRWHIDEISLVSCKRLITTGIHKDGSPISVIVDVQLVQDTTVGVRFLGWVTKIPEIK